MPESAESSLTHPQIEEYRQRGFLGPFTAFSPREMAGLRESVRDRILPAPTPFDPYGRNRHLDSRTVWQLCSAPAIVGRMASLLGPDLVLWASTIFDKRPASVTRHDEYQWHQDSMFWELEPMVSVSAWLAITSSTVENGCVDVIPGSHKSVIPTILTRDTRFATRFAGRAADPSCFDDKDKVPMLVEPGQFFLFTERTLHHSGPNLTDERRLGIGVRVTVPMVKSYHEWPCVLLAGKDSFGFNTYVDPPSREPDAGHWPGGLPDAREFAFDRPVWGLGWHLIERDGERSFCWTGPDTDSWVGLRLTSRGDHRLRCHILHAIHPRVLQGLRLSVNDSTLPLHWHEHPAGTEVEAQVPAAILERWGELVRVGLHVDETIRPCDVRPESVDMRFVGVGIHRISLSPTA